MKSLIGLLWACLVLCGATTDRGTGRVSGSYILEKVESLSNGDFRATFSPKASSADQDESKLRHGSDLSGKKLELVTHHLHVGLSEGKEFRLHAEIVGENPSKSKQVVGVSQMMIMMPYGNSAVPVWMISSIHEVKELRGARLLDMHAPTSDFLIF